jgi:hypothetical protein
MPSRVVYMQLVRFKAGSFSAVDKACLGAETDRAIIQGEELRIAAEPKDKGLGWR